MIFSPAASFCVRLIFQLLHGQRVNENERSSIVNGYNSTSRRFFVQILIRINPRGLFVCGGSIIGNTHVLSAAHCFAKSNVVRVIICIPNFFRSLYLSPHLRTFTSIAFDHALCNCTRDEAGYLCPNFCDKLWACPDFRDNFLAFPDFRDENISDARKS